MLDDIDDGSPRAITAAMAVIVLTLSMVLSGVALDSFGTMFKDWEFPALNPPPDNPGLNETDRTLFTVVPYDNPRYWRAGAYDVYTGRSWDVSNDQISPLDEGQVLDDGVEDYSGKSVFDYAITINGNAQGYIPTALNTEKVFNISGDKRLGINALSAVYAMGQVGSYSFTAARYNYTREMLTSASVVDKEIASQYYSLPLELSPEVKLLAQNKTIGARSDYEKAMLLASYLRSGEFRYTKRATAPENTDLVEWFLFTSKKGKCTEFASAFVVMARCVDLPARFVAGFALGELDGGVRIVKAAHAHTWAEVWFEKLGWVALEVTGSVYDDPNEAGAHVDGIDPSVIGGGTGGGTAGGRAGKPDLTFVGGFSFQDTRIIHEKTTKFLATVKNIGNGSSPTTLVRFNEKTGPFSRIVTAQYVPPLAAEAEYTLVVPWTPFYTGSVKVMGAIDPENQLVELNETNNEESENTTVVTGIDLVLSKDYMRFIPTSVVSGEIATAEITVRNVGDIAVTRAGSMGIWDNGEKVNYTTELTVKQFNSETVFFSWTAGTPGVHTITIRVDAGNGTADLEWSDNNLTVMLTVRNNLEIVKVVWDDRDGDMRYGQGDSVTVSVRNNVKSSAGLTVSISLLYFSQNITNNTYLSRNQTKDIELKIVFNYVEDTRDAKIIVYPSAALEKPDLTFQGNMTFTPDPKLPGNYLIKITIKNAGKRLSGPTTIKFSERYNYSSENLIGYKTVPELDPGKTYVADVAWHPFYTGEVEVIAFVDSDNLVAESNEGNNVQTVKKIISLMATESGESACTSMPMTFEHSSSSDCTCSPRPLIFIPNWPCANTDRYAVVELAGRD